MRRSSLGRVEAILGHRERAGELQFLVKWRGFDDGENMWLTEAELVDAPDLLSAYPCHC